MSIKDITESFLHYYDTLSGKEKYPLGDSQPAQIDCRKVSCKWCGYGGLCSNVSPAITLNPDKTWVCWSEELLVSPKVTQEKK